MTMVFDHPYGREEEEVLNRLWREAEDRDLGGEHPCVPVVGDHYGEDGLPRLLFVGRRPSDSRSTAARTLGSLSRCCARPRSVSLS